ncbi:hypothetical protein BLA29_005106, partial [Euroglyphus maynei]
MNSSLPRPPSSYDSMSSHQSKQSSLKNETSSMYDHNKSSRSMIDPMSGDQPQISNSYHSMMQPSVYGSQSMSPYPNHSRYDQPPPHSLQSSQYGISSELSNSSYNTSDHDSGMHYDPYNIDNGLGMPPHQTMSEYRESQANLQQSGGVPPDYPPADPYAANFDDYETTSKRKGKGRPKKDNATPKKERKPRQPRSQATRGRGRGRGSKAMMDHIPLPGMMSHEYGGSPINYGGPPPPPPLGPGQSMNDPVDMYGSNNMDMYGSHPSVLSSSASKVPSSNSILPVTPPTVNSSVLPHHQHPPPNSELISSSYGSKPASISAVPSLPTMNQSNSYHMAATPPSLNAMNSRSPIAPMSTTVPPSSLPLQPPPHPPPSISTNRVNYDSIPMADNSSSYNYVNDEPKVPTVSSDQQSSTSPIVCDNKDLMSNNSNNLEQTTTTTTKSLVPTPYQDSNFLIDSGSSTSEMNKDNITNQTSDQNGQLASVPVTPSSLPSIPLE